MSHRRILCLLLLGAAGCDLRRPQPSARESAVLVETDPPAWAEVSFSPHDERAARSVWIEWTDDGAVFVRDEEGAITSALPELPEIGDAWADVRYLSNGSVWVCAPTTVAYWNGADWRVFEDDPSASDGFITLGCDYGPGGIAGIDARGPDDAWVWNLYSACHFDGELWDCREKEEANVALTEEHTWIQNEGESEIAVLDLDGGEVGRLAMDFYPQRIVPVPGAEQIVVETEYDQNGEHSLERPQVFSPEGFVRELDADARGYSETVALGEDDFYVVTVDTVSHEDCGLFDCTTVHHWSQIVVDRWQGDQDTEVAHIILGADEPQALGGVWAYWTDGELDILAGSFTWYALP